jgi:uncharacterized protein YceH (UPF0502 family)
MELAEHVPPGYGSRVERWKHCAGAKLSLDSGGLAVLAELLLRGAQAPGELRQHAARMHPLESLADLGFVTEKLQARGLIRRMAPGTGSRAERWQHCLGEYAAPAGRSPLPETPEEVLARHDKEREKQPAAPSPPEAGPVIAEPRNLEERVRILEARLAELERWARER